MGSKFLSRGTKTGNGNEDRNWWLGLTSLALDMMAYLLATYRLEFGDGTYLA